MGIISGTSLPQSDGMSPQCKVNWDDVRNRSMEPPYVPSVGHDLDTRNFDVRFTDQPALDSPVSDCYLGDGIC